MSDAEYLASKPANCEVQLVDASSLEVGYLPECDRIVITGTDLLSESAMRWLATKRPMVFVHHEQTHSEARRDLLESARPFVCHTPAHLAVEQRWCNLTDTRLVLSALDMSGITYGEKKPVAFSAARNHPLKGLNQARLWAAKHNLECVIATDWPREHVLAMMAQAEWFIHLPLAFESECRAVMEAVLSGCTVVANDMVGITSCSNWRDPAWLMQEIGNAGRLFWEAVCES